MKSIVPELDLASKQELVDEQRKEYTFLGSIRWVPGLILFEYDLTTGELRRPSMKNELILTDSGVLNKNHRVNQTSFCLYIQALNEQNALRKVRQLLKRKSIRNQLLNPQKNG